MALITRTIIFLLSLLFIIVLLGATTGFSDEFKGEVTNENYRLYTIEWIYEKNEEDRAVVCGTKVETYDYGGRRIFLDHYAILLDEGKIVTQLRMDAVQVSLENEDTLETKKFRIKLYAGKISKDGKDILGGTRLEESDLKGLRVEFNTFKPEEDLDDFITLYKGGYDIHVYVFPVVNIRIPVMENPLYAPEKEKTLLSCIDDLIQNKEYRNSHGGEIFPEQSQNVG